MKDDHLILLELVTTPDEPALVKAQAFENVMKTRSFTAIVYKEDDMYIAECPEVGTVDQGETIEQAVTNLQEATRLYLEEFPLPETTPRYVTSIKVSYA